MPKRKVTFQGVGNEDEEDEISVPKKKVRRPDSYVLGRSEGEEKGAGSQKRGNVWGEGKGKLFMFSEKWVWRIFRLSPDPRAL